MFLRPIRGACDKIQNMKKICAVADFLTEDNRKKMTETARACGFEIEFFESAKEASGRVSDCEVIYSGGDSSILRGMPALRWCHTAFAGIGAYAESGIFDSGEVLLTNSSGAYGRTISEHIVMVSLMLMRQMPEYTRIINERRWVQDLPIRSIAGSNIVIIGTGDIGRNAAGRYRALGAKSITAFSRSGRKTEGFDKVFCLDEFDRLFSDPAFSESVDILLLCVPGTPGTRGLLSRERIAMLSGRTYVINVGRGIVIDQDALLEALKEHSIAGAALDVMYPEPLPKDHPLWDAPDCIITPHISGDMGLQYTVGVTVDYFCENLERYSAGRKLINLVDIRKGY